MEQVLLISHRILMIGGALSMVLLVLWLVYMLVVTYRLSVLIQHITQTYTMLSVAVTSPFRMLQKIFEE